MISTKKSWCYETTFLEIVACFKNEMWSIRKFAKNIKKTNSNLYIALQIQLFLNCNATVNTWFAKKANPLAHIKYWKTIYMKQLPNTPRLFMLRNFVFLQNNYTCSILRRVAEGGATHPAWMNCFWQHDNCIQFFVIFFYFFFFCIIFN